MKRVTAEFVYTLEAEPIRNGFVEYDEDGTILAIGKCNEDEEVTPGALVPGFVNAHCHVELSHLHKKFRKGTGMAGFIDQINELRDWAGFEVKQQLVREWMDKMWNDGVSAMADISNDDASFDVKKSHPMYTRTFLEVFGSEPHMCEGVMKDVAALKEVADKAGIDAAPTPHSCYTMSPQLLSASAAAGLESGYLSYHSQESQEEEDLLVSGSGAMYENRKRSGMSTPPVTGESSLKYFIDRLAAAKPAPYDEHILLVHNVCLQQSDIDALEWYRLDYAFDIVDIVSKVAKATKHQDIVRAADDVKNAAAEAIVYQRFVNVVDVDSVYYTAMLINKSQWTTLNVEAAGYEETAFDKATGWSRLLKVNNASYMHCR
jgi:cytosine/adenosine deaminase-related metal-dependent hydrolase